MVVVALYRISTDSSLACSYLGPDFGTNSLGRMSNDVYQTCSKSKEDLQEPSTWSLLLSHGSRPI